MGGLEALYYKYMEAVPASVANTTSSSTCGLPREDAFHIFRDPVHSDLPWPGVMARATLASLWNWCADQVNAIISLFAECTELFVFVFPLSFSFSLAVCSSVGLPLFPLSVSLLQLHFSLYFYSSFSVIA